MISKLAASLVVFIETTLNITNIYIINYSKTFNAIKIYNLFNSMIEKKFAYGFTTKLNKGENTATLDMAADIGRTILVKRDGEDFRAIAKIDEVESYIDKIFIYATGKGMKTKVEYIELYGKAMKGQAEQYERFFP